VKWPYDRRAESAHAWGTIGAGLALLVGILAVQASLHSTDQNFRWWWPTNWMIVPMAILAIGVVLLALPLRRSDSGRSAASPPPPDRHQAEDAPEEAPTSPTVQSATSLPPLVVTILDTTWELWRRRVNIVTLQVKITNTTSKIIRLELVRLFGDDEDPGAFLAWLSDDTLSAQEKAALSLGTMSRNTLTGGTEVGPYGDVVGVFCAAVSRSTPDGGTPALILAVRDAIGNEYRARIEEQNPKIFTLSGQ
jgi:hypothetical protein